MTKYVISGYIGFDNFGDEAICSILTNYLKEIGAEKITVISSKPEKTSKLYNVESCKMLKFFKPILESDVLISGGGSLLQDITSLKSLLYYLTVIMFAIVFNKKVYIFAQGFTPFRTKLGELLTIQTLKRCNKVTVRDTKSKELLDKYKIPSTLVSDPVFCVNIPISEEHEGIGIQLRNCAQLNEIFMTSLTEEIALKFKEQKILLFSMQDSIDLPALEIFANMLKDRGVDYKIYSGLSVDEVINYIPKLKYFIGMRFHANLVAAKAGVKTLGINYDIKVKTLAENIGFPLINIHGDEIKHGIKQLLESDEKSYILPTFKFSDLF